MTRPPFDDRDGLIWYDGDLKPWREAKVHVLTHALHYASSVFEGERVYNTNIFKLTEHSERLIASGGIMGFEIPFGVKEIEKACRDVCEANGIGDGYVRPIAWRGSEMMGVSAQGNTIHLAVVFFPGSAHEGHLSSDQRLGASGPEDRPRSRQGGGALYDLYPL